MADTNVPIYKVTLAKENKEENNRVEHLYPKSSSDIIDHQIKDTDEHTTVKKMLDDLGYAVEHISIPEIPEIPEFDSYINTKFAHINIPETNESNNITVKIAGGSLKQDSYIYIVFKIDNLLYDDTASRCNGTLELKLNYTNTDDAYEMEYSFVFTHIDGNLPYEYFYLKINDDGTWSLYYDKKANSPLEEYDIIVTSETSNEKTNLSKYDFCSPVEVVGNEDSNYIKAALHCIPSYRTPYASRDEYVNNTGYYSAVIGYDNKATGKFSTIIGYNNDSNNNYSLTLGSSNRNYQLNSFVAGDSNHVKRTYGYSGYVEEVGNSIALGQYNVIECHKSYVLGEQNKISTNDYSSYNPPISDQRVYSFGYSNTSTGSFDYIVGGFNVIDRGTHSVALGEYNYISGVSSIAIGATTGYGSNGENIQNTVIGNYTTVVGSNNDITGDSCTVLGAYNTTSNITHAIIVGERNMLLTKDTTYNTTLTSTHVFGSNNSVYKNSLALGRFNDASGEFSICIGLGVGAVAGYPKSQILDRAEFKNTSSGDMSILIGHACSSEGNESITLGHGCKTSTNAHYSISIGNYAINELPYSIAIGSTSTVQKTDDGTDKRCAISIGYNTYSSASNAISIGRSCSSVSEGAIAIGTNNYNRSVGSVMCGIGAKSTNERLTTLDNTIGDVLVIGNGRYTESLLGYITDIDIDDMYSNAFRVNNSSGAFVNGAYNTSGADYAEFVKEWYDGNPNNEDRVGYMVTIKNGKLYKANEGDYIIGITSGNPGVVGNSDECYYWKYEKDKFNRIIIEDKKIKVPMTDKDGNAILDMDNRPIMTTITARQKKLNPNYDPDQSYIERAKRPEWDYVGMRGIVPCRDDGTCEEGGFCKCGIDGMATKADTRGFDTYYVIERIDEETISVEVR